MTLHPILIGITMFIFALLAVPPMLSLARERKFGMATIMFLTVVTFAVAGFIASKVPAA